MATHLKLLALEHVAVCTARLSWPAADNSVQAASRELRLQERVNLRIWIRGYRSATLGGTSHHQPLTLLLLVQVALRVVRELLLLGSLRRCILLDTLLRHRLGILCASCGVSSPEFALIPTHSWHLRETRTTGGRE